MEVDPQHARARELAGPAACAAIKIDPDIALHDLERILARSSSKPLTELQVVSRAAKLRAFERRRRRPPWSTVAG